MKGHFRLIPSFFFLFGLAAFRQVLSDPNRRRQYDLSGGDEEAKGADYTPMDMEGIGSMG